MNHQSPRTRLIIDPPTDGFDNMAIDEALMQSVGQQSLAGETDPVLRFYQWDQPTLSLGYFQSFQDRAQHPSSLDCQWVRRNSGGGAIMHHHELTYSLTVPLNHPWATCTAKLYSLMHDTLIQALESAGLNAVKNEILQKPLEVNFLCFQRRAPNDVLIEGEKICGSAQRKKHHAISQHGSVILETSAFAPEIRGINQITRATLDLTTLIEAWVSIFSQETGANLVDSLLEPAEMELARELTGVKFSTIKWNQRR